MRNQDIRGFYYIAHIGNIPPILDRGILSRKKIETEGVQPNPIADNDIVNIRRNQFTNDGKSLWHYANLFFQPRNPTLYRLIEDIGKRNLTVFFVANTVLQERGVFITDGNAANAKTRFYPLSESLQVLQALQPIIQSSSWISWKDDTELRRKLMAECLVPIQVNLKHIGQFLVADRVVADRLEGRRSPTDIRRMIVEEEVGSNLFTPSFPPSP